MQRPRPGLNGRSARNGDKMTESLLLIFLGVLVLLVSEVLFRAKKSAATSRKGPL